MRGVTGSVRLRAALRVISTRTPHAGSDLVFQLVELFGDISTRTPHAGSDQRSGRSAEFEPISTRTPHAGSDMRRAWNSRYSS